MENMEEAQHYEMMYGDILHSQQQQPGQFGEKQYMDEFDPDMDYL